MTIDEKIDRHKKENNFGELQHGPPISTHHH